MAPKPPVVVLGLDAAWGGLGFGVSIPGRTLAWGGAMLSGSYQWRQASVLVEELMVTCDQAAEAAGLGDEYELQLAVERVALRYRGKGRRGVGNRPEVIRAVSELVGGLSLACRCMGSREPWLLEPDEWRGWYGIRGDRQTCKRGAALMAGRLVPECKAHVGSTDKLAGDVAEGILLSRGAADRLHLAPKQPTRAPGEVIRLWSMPALRGASCG